eukprot:TRINITY_DN66533_c0_g1_i1.p2 TRINITY_DN66533_c0_g1~~TRINITY_DN66533_c0_g1_i1.p2  ORF type:complete len:129 (+),score=10.96 TRINITY_DN66533_c0_g1_i1:2-388(+)
MSFTYIFSSFSASSFFAFLRRVVVQKFCDYPLEIFAGIGEQLELHQRLEEPYCLFAPHNPQGLLSKQIVVIGGRLQPRKKCKPRAAPRIKQITLEHLSELHVLCVDTCLLYTSPSPRDLSTSRMPSSA